MRKYSKKGLAVLAVGALTCGLALSGGASASADAAPTAGDVVGVGSDTLQYMLDFGADGSALSGAPGYNGIGNVNRLISFDATADANARAVYGPAGTTQTNTTGSGFDPTVVLRAGTEPVQRINGSGAAINALIADGTNDEISFIRMSRAPKASEQNAAAAKPGVGTLRVVQLAKEDLAMTVANTTNAPALSTAELKAIYTCSITQWNQIDPSLSSDTIYPLIPQVGSGTRSTFESDIGVTDTQILNATAPASGATASQCVHVSEENDPYALYVAGSTTVTNPDAISPISGARLALYASGYFNSPSVLYGATPVNQIPAVHQVKTGTPFDGNGVYDDNRGLFVVFRQSDASDAPWQAGSTKNWANTLFIGTNPYFKSSAGVALLNSAGASATGNYVDEGPGYSVG